MHKIQIEILKKLAFSEGLIHKALKPRAFMENNQLNFHLNSLIERGFVVKHDSKYNLTDEGKKFTLIIESKNARIVDLPKTYYMFVCKRILNSDTEYLFYERKKHPYSGYQGFPARKVEYGSALIDGAQKKLFEETGLSGDLELIAINHNISLVKGRSEIVDDRFYYIFRIQNPSGELNGSDDGIYQWVKLADIDSYLTKPFSDDKRILEVEQSENEFPVFSEFIDEYKSL